MRKIGVIVNLNAREYKLKKNNPYGIFEKIGGEYVLVRYTQSIDEVIDVAQEFKKEGINYVAPSGGDGTLHHVITAFMKVYNQKMPPVLILKSGTMNNVATSIHLNGDGNSILHRAVSALKKGNEYMLITRNTLKIENKYCFLFGNGITADFLNTYYSIGKSYAKLVHLITNTIIEAVTNSNDSLFKGFEGKIVCDSQAIEYTKVLGILAGSVETIGMGFYPLFRANEKADAFHVIVCAMKPRDVVKQIIKLKKGVPINHEQYFEATAKEIGIYSEKPFVYTMDGDLYHSDGTLNVTLGSPVQFIVV